MSYYNNINNIQNERVKLVFQELIDGLAYTDSSVAIASTNNIEILMAYIIHLEEKIDSFKKDMLK